MEYPNKHGVYRVGNLNFYSKLEAIEMHVRTGIHPHWDFNEAVFKSYDWTVEPQESITELYRRRAQQLREKYDYIVLMYSSGADSRNILDTFINNDIKLDELCSWVNYDATADKTNYLNAEIFENVLPQVSELQTTCPWLKHRIIDLTKHTIDYFSDSIKNKFDWIYDLNTFFNPNSATRANLPMKIKDWTDMMYAGKKVCILQGREKPRIIHKDGKFMLRFLDIIDDAASVSAQAGLKPYYDEFFYWQPDIPEIIIKQAHLIKNYLSQPNVEHLPFVSERKSDLAYREIDGKTHWLSQHGMHQLIYPQWDITTFQKPKMPSIIYSLRDTWFLDMERENHLIKNYKIGIDKLWKMLPDYWKNDPADMSKGVKCSTSIYYVLEK